ncbi:NUDIX domain-containing protein [Sphingomonas sp. RP10(2022)]|uniref:NUDIX domain-containing protein n=1 Tax=Sphingomonas liriopis TaxID=2949094 RepID=A0A9X2HZQ9_9SPHN|nr:NUDIX domain-containing protein [Sphingomonas liriopis]MCP3735845.1 NUDIX domain-containing protein [Sphingomonas liriopis]
MTPWSEPRVGCGAAIVVDGRILLLRRRTQPEAGCWGLAGGKIDLFEPAEAAMRREVEEELGIVVGTADLLCFVDQIDVAAGTHWVAPIYRIRDFTGEPRNVEPAKHDGPVWYPLDALPEPLTTPTKAALAALLRSGDAASPAQAEHRDPSRIDRDAEHQRR